VFGLDNRNGRIGSGIAVLIRTVSGLSLLACNPTPLIARGGAATELT
jgi:hypothetical protein